jgi:hypothetical protein
LAKNKSTRSRKQKKEVSLSHYLYFPEVKGKVIEHVEIDPWVEAILIMFQDQTSLIFQLDPRVSVFSEVADWKTGSRHPIKEWAPVQSKSALAKWD